MGIKFNPLTGQFDIAGSKTNPGGSTTQIQFNDSGVFGGDAGLTYNKTTDQLISTVTSLAATTSTAHLLQNTTAATTGSRIQVSPATQWSARGWRTNSGGASQSVDFRAFVTPITSTTSPSGKWDLQYSINGAAYTSALTVQSTITDGLSIPLITAAGFLKITGSNSSTVGTLQNFDIVNTSGSISHLTYRFGSTIRHSTTVENSGNTQFKIAGTSPTFNFEIGSGIESTSYVLQIYSGGLYVPGKGNFNSVVTAGSADTNTTTILSSYGSFGLKGQLYTQSATLDASQTIAYVDASNANVCSGTPTACGTYTSESPCNAHSLAGCTWVAGTSCSGASGTDSGTCTNQGGTCTWDEVACSGANNTDQSTCELQDDSYGGSCTWDTGTCPSQGDQSSCQAIGGCTWNFSDCGAFNGSDQGTCETNSGCSWTGGDCSAFNGTDQSTCESGHTGCVWNSGDSLCEGTYTESSICSGQYDVSCTGSICSGNYNTGNCSGSFGSSCSGTASCDNLTDDGAVACAAEAGCTWTPGATITLPTETSANRNNTSRIYKIMNIGASGNVIVIPNPADSGPSSAINGSSSITLSSQYSQLYVHHHNVFAQCSVFSSAESCTPNGCSWTPKYCGSDFADESSCNAQSGNGCAWNGMIEACEGTYTGSDGSCSGQYVSARKWFKHNHIT